MQNNYRDFHPVILDILTKNLHFLTRHLWKQLRRRVNFDVITLHAHRSSPAALKFPGAARTWRCPTLGVAEGHRVHVQGASLFLLLQPVPCSKRLTMLLPVAVLSVTLEGQPTTIPLSEFVTVLPITVPGDYPGLGLRNVVAGYEPIGVNPDENSDRGITLHNSPGSYPEGRGVRHV